MTAPWRRPKKATNDDVLAELTAIRTLLEQAIQSSYCPHGTVGFCMPCVLPSFDGIEQAVRDGIARGSRTGAYR